VINKSGAVVKGAVQRGRTAAARPRFNELLARHPLPSVMILDGYVAASKSLSSFALWPLRPHANMLHVHCSDKIGDGLICSAAFDLRSSYPAVGSVPANSSGVGCSPCECP
jgi:hypothetical protein